MSIEAKTLPSSKKIVIPPDEPIPSNDGLAREEDKAIARNRDLTTEERENVHDRRQRIANHITDAAVFAIWFISCLLVIGIIICGFHLIAPSDWRWLPDDQVSRLKDMFLSGALASAITGLARYAFPQKRK